MCMEDVRIGRDTMGGIAPFSASNASNLAIAESVTRVSLVLTRPLAGTVTYSTERPAVSGVGINLGVGDSALSLDIATHGDLVRRAWYAVLDAGNQNMAVFFSDLPRV
jgi:hypothetical protein